MVWIQAGCNSLVFSTAALALLPGHDETGSLHGRPFVAEIFQ
jgi:hypothetical protein